MEIEDSHSDMCVDSSLINSVPSIESRVQFITFQNETEMLEDPCASEGSIRNNPDASISNQSQDSELSESTKAFLQFQKERDNSTFSRTCLFCKKHFTGNRSLLFDHFTEEHNFFMGQPDNLVYINEFLDILENMLNKLQCIFCEKLFHDWAALKEHMRKKMHKRINPKNKLFDKFYICNYLSTFNAMDFTCHDTGKEKEIEIEPMDDSIICLYCDSKFSDFDEIMNHLKVVHDFDFRYMKKQFKLCFYSQIKLINYIRQKVLANECTICETPFNTKEALSKHLTVSRHIKLLPPRAKWDQSEYFFSTLDTDYLLCGLQMDDEDDDEDDDGNVEIISEDIVLPESSVLIDEILRKQLM